MYNITGHFLWYQAEGDGPLDNLKYVEYISQTIGILL